MTVSAQYLPDFQKTVYTLAELESKSECRFKKIKAEFDCLNFSDKFSKELPNLQRKLTRKVIAYKGAKEELFRRTLASLAEKHPDQFAEYDAKSGNFVFKADFSKDLGLEDGQFFDPKAMPGFQFIDPKANPAEPTTNFVFDEAAIPDTNGKDTLAPEKRANFRENFLFFLEVLLKILKIAVQIFKLCNGVAELGNAVAAA